MRIAARTARTALTALTVLSVSVGLAPPARAQEAAPPPPAPTEAAPATTEPATTDPATADPARAGPAEAAPAETAPPADTAPAEEPAVEASSGASDPAADPSAVSGTAERRIGDPVPYTRREPMTNALGFQLGARYGLVGTGPTRFVDDIRFGVTEWLELRTALLPYPSSLMARFALGKQQSDLGVLLLDAGLAHFDAGVRLVPDTGEAQAGVRFHLEGGAAYARAIGDRMSVYAQAHYRYRLSFLDDDDQHALAVDGHVFYDLTNALAVSGGLGVATTLGTPVRELGITFVETDQPGMSHLISRDEGSTWSVTVPITMTYGRVENFDVDLFCTPRIFPELGILFGAGVRLRLDPFTS